MTYTETLHPELLRLLFLLPLSIIMILFYSSFRRRTGFGSFFFFLRVASAISLSTFLFFFSLPGLESRLDWWMSSCRGNRPTNPLASWLVIGEDANFFLFVLFLLDFLWEFSFFFFMFILSRFFTAHSLRFRNFVSFKEFLFVGIANLIYVS